MNVADMMIDTYLAESLLLRVQKLSENELWRKVEQSVYDAILKVYMTDAVSRMHKNATDALLYILISQLNNFLLSVEKDETIVVAKFIISIFNLILSDSEIFDMNIKEVDKYRTTIYYQEYCLISPMSPCDRENSIFHGESEHLLDFRHIEAR